MTRLTKCFRGIKLFAALLGVMLSGQAQASGVTDAKGWLRTFSVPIGEAYILRPLSAFESGPAISEVYIETIYNKRGVSELVSFQDGKVLGAGCFINIDRGEERPQHLVCQKQAHRNIALRKLMLTDCHLDKDENGYPRNAIYFVARNGTQATCAFRMPTLLGEGALKHQKNFIRDLLVTMIQPMWKVDQQPEVNLDNTGLLAYLFPGAPIQQLDKLGLNGARNCFGLPNVLAAYAAESKSVSYGIRTPSKNENLSEIYIPKVPDLTRSDMRWSYFYLALTKKPIVCVDAKYDIDILNKPIADGLGDNTMLIRGQRTVLRINVSDGSSKAESTLVKRVGAREFIETMQTDYGDACRTYDEKNPCKWHVQQGLYERARRYPSADFGELEYSRFWFQGFDQAVKRVYFSKGR